MFSKMTIQKIFFTFLFFITINSLAFSQEVKITKAGYLASTSKNLLDKAIEYKTVNDGDALQKIMGNNLVFMLKGGMKVYVVDTNFLGGKVKIRPVGETIEIWTLIEALCDNRLSKQTKTFQGIKYTIIGKSTLGDIKCSLEVMLEKKTTKKLLRNLAFKLQKEEPVKYKRMFIAYLLPGMISGSGAWATSHFNPDLEVKILGMSIEEESALKSAPRSPCDEMIGEWMDSISEKYELYRRNGNIYMNIKYKDGSSRDDEMIQTKQYGQMRYEEKMGNDFGEYYLIDNSGILGVYDSEGLIKSVKPLYVKQQSIQKMGCQPSFLKNDWTFKKSGNNLLQQGIEDLNN